MTKAWYIDTLDARGGYAFASYREGERQAADSFVDAETTVFLSPPAFSPEPVAGRETALAAGRGGSFQEGLFVEEAEVPFASLADVTAFVSRLYSAGGGGDTPTGGEGPPVGPEGLGPGTEGSEEDRETDALSTSLRSAIADFEGKADHLTLGEPGQTVEWIFEDDRTGRRPFDQKSLQQVALRLEREIWARVPQQYHEEDILTWLETVHSLIRLVALVGLDWERLLLAWVASIDQRSVEARQSQLQVLFPTPAPEAGPDRLEISLFSPFWWHIWPSRNGGSDSATDVLTCLGRLPLTKPARSALGPVGCPEAKRSLFTLLTVAAAAPTCLSAGSQIMAEFLFAVCAVVAAADPLRTEARNFAIGNRPRVDLSPVSLNALRHDVVAWLRASLPDRALPKELEKMIVAASSLTYDGASTPVTAAAY